MTHYYVNCLNEGLIKHTFTSKTTNELLYKAIEYCKEKICAKYSLHNYLPYSTAIIFKIEDNNIQYSVLGDSYLTIKINEKEISISDNRLKSIAIEERKLVQELRENNISEKSDTYIKARTKLIETELKYQNKENGYWVAGINPEAAYNSISSIINFNQNDKITIIAASDGLQRLVTHFSQYDSLYNIGQEIINNGDQYIFSKLRTLENKRENFLKPASSKHDDASYILIYN